MGLVSPRKNLTRVFVQEFSHPQGGHGLGCTGKPARGPGYGRRPAGPSEGPGRGATFVLGYPACSACGLTTGWHAFRSVIGFSRFIIQPLFEAPSNACHPVVNPQAEQAGYPGRRSPPGPGPSLRARRPAPISWARAGCCAAQTRGPPLAGGKLLDENPREILRGDTQSHCRPLPTSIRPWPFCRRLTVTCFSNGRCPWQAYLAFSSRLNRICSTCGGGQMVTGGTA